MDEIRTPASSTGDRRWRDIGAGLCVAGLLIPEAVAYAGLAQLPVGHALSATLIGLGVYALFGRSRFAIVTPTSSSATLSAAAVVSMPGIGQPGSTPAYAQALTALVLLAGGLLMLLAWARQGQLSAFVSRPVLRGFAFALAVTIVVKQLPDALGLALPAEGPNDPFHVLLYTLLHPGHWHAPSAAVALVAAALLVGLRRWRRLPVSLLVIVLAITAAWTFDLAGLGVAEVGAVARPTLAPAWPQLELNQWLRAGELAFGLVVLVFAESWGSIRSAALAHGDRLDANRELLVLGACNAGAALFQGMAVGAGFSATSANVAAGAKSRLAGVVALLVIALALIVALPVLPVLPRPVLAVAVIAALWNVLSVRPLYAVWRTDRDRLALVTAVVAVLLLGVLDGMLVAVALSVLSAIGGFSRPVVHELGELGRSRNFVVLTGHPQAAPIPGLLVLRPEAPLFFASAERVTSEVMDRLEQATVPVVAVILSLEESADLDSTAVECLRELDLRLARRGQRLVLARVKDAVRELLARCDREGLGRDDRLHWSVADAVQALAPRPTDEPDWGPGPGPTADG